MVAVVGTGGTGASTICAALARALGRRHDRALLVDLDLHAGLTSCVPGASRRPGVGELLVGARPAIDPPPDGQLRMVPGLAHPSDWTALPAGPALADLLTTLAGSSSWLVCDVGSELEGRARTGSLDVEDRHRLARTAAACAQVVLLVVAGSEASIRRGAHLLGELEALGVDRRRVVIALSRVARPVVDRWRREAHDVLVAVAGWTPATLEVVPWRRAAGRRRPGSDLSLPPADRRRLADAVVRRARLLPPAPPPDPGIDVIEPGSLGMLSPARWGRRAG